MRYLIIVATLSLVLAACQSTPTPPSSSAAAAGGPAPAPTAVAGSNPIASSGGAPTTSAVGAGVKPASSPTATSAPPTQTPRPTATASPSPSPTPVPKPRQLTQDGCCVAPSWSPDGSKIIYLDKPSPDAQTAYYGIDVTTPGAKPEVFEPRVAQWTGDFKYITTRGDGFATVERPADGKTWRINTGRCGTIAPTGCQVTLSPDRQQVVWSITAEATGPFEQRHTQIRLANIDGTNIRTIANLLSTRAGASWFPDGRRLLISGRPDTTTQDIAFWVLDLNDGSMKEILRGERINRGALSPDGQWLFYSIVLDDQPDRNGLWIVRTDGTDQRKLPFFGPAAWRSNNKLVYIPFQPETTTHSVWEYDVDKNTTRQLTDPKTTPFKISFGDWALSPDGKRIVYMEAQDRNLYVLDIPN